MIPHPRRGLCLLLNYSDVSAAYNCEALDVVAVGGGKPQVMYRLDEAKSSNVTDDECMYQLREGELRDGFGPMNSIFEQIAEEGK